MINRSEKEIIEKWNKNTPETIVSICCTSYNHETYIEDALDGFLIQKTDFPFEILIRDDCSDDSTAEIIRAYAKRYPSIIKAYYEKENTYSQGVGPFTQLLKKPKAKYIALCEGDDYWTDPYKLQRQVEILEKNPEISLVATKTVIKNANSSHITGRAGFFDICDFIKRDVILSTASVMFRRCNYDKDARELHELYPGDWSIFLSQLKKGRGYVMDDAMTVYRQHEGGVFSSLRKYEQYRISLDDYIAYLQMKKRFSIRERECFFIGARKRLSQVFVGDYEHEPHEIETAMKDYKIFLERYEYLIFLILYRINRWLFARLSWRIMRFTDKFYFMRNRRKNGI